MRRLHARIVADDVVAAAATRMRIELPKVVEMNSISNNNVYIWLFEAVTQRAELLSSEEKLPKLLGTDRSPRGETERKCFSNTNAFAMLLLRS